MNRRQFTQSLAALFATPALPPVSIAAAAPSQAIPATAYFWADYMTRLHHKCTPDMLAPFFRADTELAKTLHARLVADKYLMANGTAHPNLLAKQPTKTFGHSTGAKAQSAQSTKPAKTEMRTDPMTQNYAIRPATVADQDALTDIWAKGWVDGHGDHVPAELTALRTRDSFYTRLTDMIPTTVVATLGDKVIGFCAVKDAEIYQMYVASDARGTGVAAALITAGCDQ